MSETRQSGAAVWRSEALEPFGRVFTGLDAGALGDDARDAIERALAEEGVAVLRGQGVDDDGFLRFLRGFGEMTFTVGETPLAHRPELNFVTNANRTTPPRSVFHTDTSYVSRPPAYTALRAVEIPRRGGATVFSNQFDAFERLDGATRERLRGLRVLHRVSGLPGDADGERETWHPLLRRHPVSGRTALFLSTPERCVAVEGMDEAEGRALIERLYAHSTVPDRLYRHAWRPGDIVMWDDRCTLHKADHSDVEGLRTLHRGMVAGEVPLAA